MPDLRVGRGDRYARPLVNRRMTVLGLVVVGALLLAGCDKSTGAVPAATVNGAAVSGQAFVHELDLMQANAKFFAAKTTQREAQNLKTAGTAPGTVDTSFAVSVLQGLIDSSLLHQEVERRKLKADDQCTTSAQSDVQDHIAGFQDFPQDYRRTLVARDLDRLLLEADLAGQPCVVADPVTTYFENHKSDFDSFCLAVIVVANPETAAKIKADLDEGEDFADLAKANSLDPNSAANGGEIGCLSRAELADQVAEGITAAKPGGIAGPYDLQGASFLIKVLSRKPNTLEAVRERVAEVANLAVTRAYQTWLQKARATSLITVDGRIGRWDPTQGTIIPAASEAQNPGAGQDGSVPDQGSSPASS